MVFVTFFNMLGDMGFGPAIIQNKKLTQKEIEEIFTITILIGIMVAIIFSLFSYLIANFYDNSIYTFIGKLLSIAIFFNIVNIVPMAILYKEKNFQKIAIGSIIINILVGIIVVILAINGWSYYSLVTQSILTSFFVFVYNLFFSKIKVSFKINFKSIGKISNYSKFQFLFNIINYFSRNSDNILIGKFLGVDALGLYDKAYKLMLYPVQNLTFVITPVLHPILSEYQDNKKVIFNSYKKLVKILAILGGFFSVICFFGSKEIITILFGDQWIQSVTTFKILSITIIFQMIASSSGVIFQSTGYVDKLFLSGLISAIINVLGIIIGVILGRIELVAMGIMLAFIINFFQTFFILIKCVFKDSYIKFLYSFKNVLMAMIVSSISLWLINFKINNPLISISLKTTICICSYGLVLFFTKEYKELNILMKKGR